mgnify:CR=1 FL=1
MSQPEPRTLFNLDADGVSQPETLRGPSQGGTPAPPAQVAAAEETDPLHAVREAATMEAAARTRLVDAITAARTAGHSWRTLGIESGIPHQTLHRRLRYPDSDPGPTAGG